MNKTQLFKKIDTSWSDLLDSFASQTDTQLAEPGVMEDWSVKDILAHVTTWEEEALKFLPLILTGGRPPRYSVQYGGIDAFNAQMHERKRGLSVSEVLSQLEEVHRRLIDLVREVPDEEIVRETRFRRRLRFDSYRHYSEHAEMIRAWRERPSG